MNRRKARENAFLTMFSISFGEEMSDAVQLAREERQEFAVDAFGESLLKMYSEHTEEIEHAISEKLKGWQINRLPKVSSAILRLAVAEMLYGKDDMDSIIINEAVELAKKFGDESDYQFINGVLGSISRENSGKTDDNEVTNSGEV